VILDPKLGGKLRALVAILSAVVVVLTSPALADLGWEWVAPVVATLNALLSGLAHFTSIGNTEAP
jgi:hypothetical protein